MVQASSVFFVATAALYAASPVLGAGIPKAGKALGKEVVHSAHSGHPAEHNASVHGKPEHQHEHEQEHEHKDAKAGKSGKENKDHDSNRSRLSEKGHEHPGDRRPSSKGGKPGKEDHRGQSHEHGDGHSKEHGASRLAHERPGSHEHLKGGKEHQQGRLGSQRESNRHELSKTGKGGLRSQNRLSGAHGSEHQHEHDQHSAFKGTHDSHSLSGQRGQSRPGQQGRLGHEHLARPESAAHGRTGQQGRLGHENLARPESGAHSRPQSQPGQHRPEQLSRPNSGAHSYAARPGQVGSTASRVGSTPPPPPPSYNPANQAALKSEIDSLYHLEGRDWDEELYLRDFDDDLYVRDFDEDLYVRGPEGKGKSHHGRKQGKNSHKHHKQMLAAEESAATDPSQTSEPPSTREWDDDLYIRDEDLLEFAQRSYYDYYDDLD